MAAVSPSVLRGVPPLVRKPVSPLAAAAGGAPGPAPATGILTPQQIAQQAAGYTATLPRPSTDAQIGAQAQGELGPIMTKVTQAIQGQAQRAGQAISGYSDSLAKALAGTDFSAPYTHAEDSQAAVDSSLASALAGGGTSAANDLRSRLASINEPGVVDQAANAVQATGTGNLNANLASGSAALSDLIAHAAAADEYGAKQPGLAKLAGLQGITQANQSAQSQIADKTASLEGELPTILNELRARSDMRAGNIASVGAKVQGTLVGQNNMAAKISEADKLAQVQTILKSGYDPATGQLTPQARAQLAAATGYDPVTGKPTARTSIDAQNADANTLRADIASGKAAAAGTPKFNSAASRAVGYRSDQYGNPIGGKLVPLPGFTFGAHGNIVKTPSGSAATRTHGFSAEQTAKLRGNALNIAENAALGGAYGADKALPGDGSRGGYSSKGAPLPQVTREQALNELQQSGIPDWIAIPALNKYYGTPGAQNAASKFFNSTSLGFNG